MPRRLGERRTVGAYAIVAVIAASLIATGLTLARQIAPALVELEHFAADFRTAALADTAPGQHPDIAVVMVSEEALAQHAGHTYRSPTDRAVLARLVSIIDQAEPRVIGLDYIFDRQTEIDKDAALIGAIRGARNRLVLGVADVRAELTPAQAAYQSSFTASVGRPLGHLSLTYDRDGVVRYLSRPARDGVVPLSFAEQLAVDSPPRPARASQPPIMPIAVGDYRDHRIAWLQAGGLKPEEAFRSVPAIALLDAAGDPSSPLAKALGQLLKGRIVIIGGDFADLDRHETPLKSIGAPKLAGVMLHAHMVAQLIDRRSITHAAEWVQPILLFGLAFLGFVIGLRYNIERYVYGVGVAVLIALDVSMFLSLRTVMPFTLPLFAWLAGASVGRNADLIPAWMRG